VLSYSTLTEHTSSAVLDLVFSREPELVSNVKIVENLGTSDHNMVSFSIHHEQNNFVNTRQIRDYNKGDYQSIREELKQTDWNVCMSGKTTECWNNF